MTKVSLVLLVFIIFSCNTGNSIPQDIIKPAQMQNIFWDMIRGDILAQETIKKDSAQNLKNASLAITEKILTIHHTDKVKFEKSIAFYEKHPVLMRAIFDSLSAIQARKNYSEPEKRSIPVKDHRFPKSKKML